MGNIYVRLARPTMLMTFEKFSVRKERRNVSISCFRYCNSEEEAPHLRERNSNLKPLELEQVTGSFSLKKRVRKVVTYRSESMSTAAGIVQGSNLVASHLGRAPEWRLNNGEIVNCRSAFLGKLTFPTSGFRLSVEMKGKRKNSSSSSASVVVLASGDAAEVQVETPEEVLSGEWPGNFSMLNYEDLSSYLEPMIFKEEAQPSAFLGDVMSKTIRTATAEQLLEEIDYHFAIISGLPVTDKDLKCIGVISKKDKAKSPKGLKSTVGEVMSSPAITLSAEKTVLDAAVLMLKNKIHRIPIVNDGGQVVGIVTRTDIFNALEGLPN